MGSTRLPGKVVADLGGQPMLGFLLDRLRPLPVDQIVVATSDLPGDDVVAEVATAAGVGVVRGPEQDVLARFALAVRRHPARHVVRITGDCPLTDPAVVATVVDLHLARRADYTSNVLPRTFPQGLDVEVVTADALLLADADARAAIEREHVTPYLYRHPERFRLANLRSGDDLGEERWTVDTPADLAAVRDIVRRAGVDPSFGWRDALGVVGRRALPPTGALRLRPADPRDADDVLRWRNDPDSVRFSLMRTSVDPVEHALWFAARLDDPATRLLIGEVDGRSIGMARVDIEDATGTVSIAVNSEHRGQGFGRELLIALVKSLTADVGVDRLVALVRNDNTASNRSFLNAGFSPTSSSQGIERYTWHNPARDPLGDLPGARATYRNKKSET